MSERKHGAALDEQETINYSYPRALADRAATYTTIPADIRYYRKLAAEHPDEVKIIRDDGTSVDVEYPHQWAPGRARPKKHRVMSDEQRAAAAARMKALRTKKEGGEKL